MFQFVTDPGANPVSRQQPLDFLVTNDEGSTDVVEWATEHHADPVRARTLIATFAEFLRASFRTQADLTTVSEELRLVEAYLDLEQARFGGRFDVALNIAPKHCQFVFLS